MPPKAMEQTDIDDLLCELMPKELSKNAKIALINDAKIKSLGFGHNYQQLTDTGAAIDITNDYALMVLYANFCIDALKTMWK